MDTLVAGEQIAGTSLTFSKADPLDERLDTFECGPDWWALEITAIVQNRPEWLPKEDLYLFSQGDEIVAAAQLGFRKILHPDRDSGPLKERYFLILALGVNAPFQGKKDPVTARSYAGEVLAYIDVRARARGDCIGVSLHVRDENVHAREVYERAGFEYQPEPFLEDDHLTWEMRKLLGDRDEGTTSRP